MQRGGAVTVRIGRHEGRTTFPSMKAHSNRWRRFNCAESALHKDNQHPPRQFRCSIFHYNTVWTLGYFTSSPKTRKSPAKGFSGMPYTMVGSNDSSPVICLKRSRSPTNPSARSAPAKQVPCYSMIPLPLSCYDDWQPNLTPSRNAVTHRTFQTHAPDQVENSERYLVR